MNRSRARAIRRKYQRRTRVTVQKAWILSALAAAVIVYGAAAVIREKGREAKGTQVSIETPDSTQMPEALETEFLKDVRVGTLNLSGLTMEQAVSRVRETYRWDMRIRNGEESVSLEDLAGPQLEKILETIEHGDKDKPQSYELDYGRMEQAFAQLQKAHDAQTEVIQNEAAGTRYENSFIFNHAQDTMMAAMTQCSLTREIIELYKILYREIHKDKA